MDHQTEKALKIFADYVDGEIKGVVIKYWSNSETFLGIRSATTPTDDGPSGFCRYLLYAQQRIQIVNRPNDEIIIAVTTDLHVHVYFGTIVTYEDGFIEYDPLIFLGQIDKE
jgi:hypothetical protein